MARRRKTDPASGRDSKRGSDDDDMKLVRPDGLAVRRRRHDRGWSSRELTGAIEEARFNSSGLRETLTPNQIEAIEERAERISYDQLMLLADGLDCDPVDLLAEGELSSGPRPPVRILPPKPRLN